MNYTSNYNLNLPEGRDAADVSKLNDNFSKLDSTVKTVDSRVTTVDGRVTTVDNRVTSINTTLQNSINTNKTTLQNSIDSLKTELNNTINSVKNTLNDSIEGVNNDLSAAIDEVNDELSADISSVQSSLTSSINTISSQRKPVVGSYTGNGGMTRVFALGFKPSVVIVSSQYGLWNYRAAIATSYFEIGIPNSILAVTSSGFSVYCYSTNALTNVENEKYFYAAWR